MRFVYKIGIFACLLCVFFMSHNVSALDASINLNDYEVVPISIDPGYYDFVFDTPNYSCTQAYNCTFRYGSRLKQASTHSYYHLKAGDIVTYQIYIFSTDVTDGLLYNLQVRPLTPGYGVSTYYIHQVSDTNLPGFIASGNVGSNTGVVYEVALKYDIEGDYRLGSFNTNTIDMVLDGGLNNSNGTGPTISLTGFTVYRYSGSTENKEQAQATQDAADDSETQAQGNSTSTQTTNLIGAFQSFVTALTNLSSTNCNVTLAWPSSLGGNMQVNICQNKDYAGNIISVFGSLTLIVFYIPFSLKILSMIYNEIRSFTNG